MRILISFYSPWWNAPAYYAVSLAVALQESGHEVCFLGQEGTPSYDEAGKNIRTCVSAPLSSLRPDKLAQSVWIIRKAVRLFKPEVINCHSSQDFSLSYAALRIGCKHIPVLRTRCDHRTVQDNFMNRLLYRNWADTLIFPSQAALKRALRMIHVDDSKTSVVYSGMHIDRFLSNMPPGIIRPRFGLDESVPVVGIIARLSPVKGHGYFLQMVKTVLMRTDNCFFVISGEDAQISLSDLEEQAHEMNIDGKIAFLGKVGDPRSIITDLDIGIVTSQDSEVVCRIAAEYMSMGKPVIATDVNVLPEMVENEKTGFICPSDDPEEMAERVFTLIQDSSKRRSMGKAAHERASQCFDIRKTAEKTLNIYRFLVS